MRHKMTDQMAAVLYFHRKNQREKFFGLIRTGLIWYAPDGVDIIGLSASDYLSIRPELRSIFFSDADTKRSDEDIVTNIEASPYLNNGWELVGRSGKGYALFEEYADIAKPYSFLGASYPPTPSESLLLLYNDFDGGQESLVGPDPTYSYDGVQYDFDGVSVGSVPAYHPGKGIWCGPAYANLFTAGPSGGAQTVSLTAVKYCLQVFDTGTVTCSYGTATVENPLKFPATAGDTEFTPNGAGRWMLSKVTSSAASHEMPYVAPGVSKASAIGTTTKGLSFTLPSAIVTLLSGNGPMTLACLAFNPETNHTGEYNAGLLTVTNVMAGILSKSNSGRLVKGTDGTTALDIIDTWSPNEFHLGLIQTDGSGNFRVGARRLSADLFPIEDAQYGTLTAFDGSFAPSSNPMRVAFGNLDPTWIKQIQLWNKQASTEEIIAATYYCKPKPTSKGDIEIFLVMGQSNADGRGLITELSGGLSAFYTYDHTTLKCLDKVAVKSGTGLTAASFIDDGLMFYLSKERSTIKGRTSQNVQAPATYFGVELPYGYSHFTAHPTNPLCILKAAVGGTGIETSWKVTTPDAASLWKWFKTTIHNRAISWLIEQGYNPVIKKVFWMQGETDADAGVSEAAYAASLRVLVGRLNTELYNTPTQIIIGGLSSVYNTTNGTKIKNAQQTVAGEFDNCVYFSTDSYGLSDIHYTAAALETMGADLFNL